MTHILIRIGHMPGEPSEFRAWCGYVGTEKREFVDPTSRHWSVEKVSCEECMERLAESTRRETWQVD